MITDQPVHHNGIHVPSPGPHRHAVLDVQPIRLFGINREFWGLSKFESPPTKIMSHW